MQTFLPYPDFAKSAACLDDRRLGKQRVEALQILQTLTGKSTGWTQHPAAIMWKGYEPALVAYGLAICEEWIYQRGFIDSCRPQIKYILKTQQANPRMPPWLGDMDFHLSHQSNLLRKDPAFYGPKFPGVRDNLRYVWPGVPERRAA